MSDSLTLSDILSRQLRIEWHEAVSVVRALIALVQPVDPMKIAYASLEEIELSSSGALSLHGHSFGASPGLWAATVLQTLIAKSDPPVQLRLLTLQSAAEGSHVAQLDESLAYFERPNRVAVLQALYARAAAAVPDAMAAPPVLQVPAVAAAAATPQVSARPAIRWSAVLKAAAVALLALAVAGGASWILYTKRDALPAADAGAAQKVVDGLGDAMLAGVSKITETAGLGRLVSPDAPPSPAPASAPTARDIRLPRAPRRPAEPIPPPIQEIAAFDLAPLPAAAAPPAAPPSADEPQGVAEIVGDDSVYAEGAPGIAPPVGIRPQLARELPASVRQEDLTPLELVIGTDGSIESVRLIDPPKNVIDSMILSVAKAWEFEPALKDGKPVKYRKTVWIRAR